MDDASETPSTVDWDERYASSDEIWSGEPNATMVGEVRGLTPGRALDVGCGEGADAVWLAEQGWDVTALDVSRVALDRAQARAARVDRAITWIHAALLDAELPAAGFDLVTAQYPALRRTPGDDAERALLAAVAPSGTVLVVHHHITDPTVTNEHGFTPAEWVGPRDVAKHLGHTWRIDVDEVRPRSISGGSGSHHDRDVVLRASRVS